MTGSALKRWTLYWDCFSERMLENWEGVQGEGGSKFDLIGGMRMTGSAFKRWTFYWAELKGGGPGGGELKIGPYRRDADFSGSLKSMAGAVFSSLLRKNSILDVLKT